MSNTYNHTANSTGLGWASMGIGLAELAMPNRIERWLGIEDGRHTRILRTLGMRELGHGGAILADDPVAGVWSRVAGDVLDGVLLGVAATKTRNPRGFALVSAAVLGIAVYDVWRAVRLSWRR